MNEKSPLMRRSSLRSSDDFSSVSSFTGADDDTQWGGTPALRTLWNQSAKRKEVDYAPDNAVLGSVNIGRESPVDAMLYGDDGVPLDDGDEFEQVPDKPTAQHVFSRVMMGTPGLLIALVLNLFLSMSFGQALFPTSWVFPPEVPRAMGVQMWLFSTMIAQVVMTALSEFPTAMGMMMVENIPFLHIIADMVISVHGPGVKSFSTVLVAYGLSTLVVGVFFYLLGKTKAGNAVYFFPRFVIVGCIGGIGIFIMQTGVEVSTDLAWEWTLEGPKRFVVAGVAERWIASFAFVVLLRVILFAFNAPLLPPFYFVAIPPAFYCILALFSIPVQAARDADWFFPAAENVDPFLMWELIDFRTVDWQIIGNSIPTMIALTIFSLMHVPINIPSLSMSTHVDVDMNKELMAHGYSNFITGLFGGLQNYLCYSNSLLYYKCKGGGKVSGYLMALITGVFFLMGPSVVYYMPRVMPGCLLIHIGIDLSTEALYDSWGSFDSMEYASIVVITLTMNLYGMTAGLGLGVVLAAFTFTLQTSGHVDPIRGKMSGRTLRSSSWRNATDAITLNHRTRYIVAIQLQGHLFFGNASLLTEEVEKVLQRAQTPVRHPNTDTTNQGTPSSVTSSPSVGVGFGSADSDGSTPNHHANNDPNRNKRQQDKHNEKNLPQQVWFVVLDFTLVVGIDSSAAETIVKIYKLCRQRGVRLCYSAGSGKGFPCTFPLSDTIRELDRELIRIPESECCGKCASAHTIVSTSTVDLDASHIQSPGPSSNSTGGYGTSASSSSSSSSGAGGGGGGACSVCRLNEDFTRPKWVYLASNLNSALAWCEDIIIAEEKRRNKIYPCSYLGGGGGGGGNNRSGRNSGRSSNAGTPRGSIVRFAASTVGGSGDDSVASGGGSSMSTTGSPGPGNETGLPSTGSLAGTALKRLDSPHQVQQQHLLQAQGLSSPAASTIPPDVPTYLHQIYLLTGSESRQNIGKLMSYFAEDFADAGSVLWLQGSVADRAILLIHGRMQHLLEEEAETTETIYPGHLVGEYGLLNQQPRMGTLTALEDCRMLVLRMESFEMMARNDPYLAFILSKICMAYLGRRVMHVSNRIWESNCLPV